MRDENKTIESLLSEIVALRQQVAEFESLQNGHKGIDPALEHNHDRPSDIVEQTTSAFFEAWSRPLVEQAADAFFVVERDGRIVDVNQTACDTLGYSREELLALTVPDVDVGFDLKEFTEVWDHLIPGVPITLEETYIRHDGTAFPVEVRSSIIEVAGRQRLLVLVRDTTERKHTEKELIRLERLRSLGEMAGGFSHNLNNILVSVLGPAQLIQRSSDDPQILRWAESIIDSASRARDLVQGLYQTVQTEEEGDIRPVSIDEVVKEAVLVAQPRWKDEPESRGVSIEVVTQLGDVPAIRGTPSGLHKVLINLLLNAVDAMPEGGTITIGTQVVKGHVRLTVRDTGTGMNEETCKHIFEPLFNRRADGAIGLGLFTVYSAISRWGGFVDVETAPGENTVFTIRLPVWTGPEAQKEEVTQVSGGRRGRVLIVEDDETVCNVLSDLLSSDHEVSSSTSGEDGLAKLAQGSFDVALIDLGLPTMPGDQVAQKMKQVGPSLVTVLITGWGLGDADLRLLSFDYWLQKPVDLEEVKNVIAKAVSLHDTRVEHQR